MRRSWRTPCSQPGRATSSCATPGHPDAELAALDPVVERRRMEYEALMRDVSLPERIWRPSRGADGPPVDWSQVRTSAWRATGAPPRPAASIRSSTGWRFLFSGGLAFLIDAIVLSC